MTMNQIQNFLYIFTLIFRVNNVILYVNNVIYKKFNLIFCINNVIWIFKKFPYVLVINLGLCGTSFENIKMLLLETEPTLISIILSVNKKPKGKVTNFHDALHYLTCIIELNPLALEVTCIFFYSSVIFKVMVTDRELALINVIEVVFSTHQLTCYVHFTFLKILGEIQVTCWEEWTRVNDEFVK